MCDPITIGVMAVTAVSGGMQAYGQYQQGVANQQYYNYLAETNRIQGDAQYRAGMKESELIQDAAKHELKTFKGNATQFASEQKVRMVANGVDLGSVSASDVVGDTIDKAKMDEYALRYNADSKSWSTETGAKYKKYEGEQKARNNKYAGAMAKYQGKQKAFTTLLSTAGSMAMGAVGGWYV